MDDTNSSMEGYAPTVTVGKARPPERDVYREAWKHPEYREVAPGESCAMKFLQQAQPKKGATVLDLGCGTGRGGTLLAALGGMNVTFVDFADNCLDDTVVELLQTHSNVMRFHEADLTKEIPLTAEYGFCTDVLEHIPESDVDKVLDNCLVACQHTFFQISTVDDVMGGLVGHPLHLTVKPYAWWLKKFNERDCTIHWSQDNGNACMFYVTAWWDGSKIVDIGVLNTDEEVVKKNVRHNIQQGWIEISPHETNNEEVMILGGGPSTAEFLEDIKKKRAEGVKLVALNGAYGWCIENGLTPSALIMVDAREFNARFSKPVVDGCKYLIASQCDPAVFEGLPKERTYIWHTTTEMIRDILNEHSEIWYVVPGGSTVLLRAIPLLRMLGFKKFHLYGCDSCLSADKHHAYAQPENDAAMVLPAIVGGRTFHCHAWMVSQAQEFMDMIRFLGDEIELELYGDGLLTHILNTGAKIHDEMELAAEQEEERLAATGQ